MKEIKIMKTREELIDAIESNVYTTQKDLANILGETQQAVSRMLTEYGLKELYTAHKASKTKTQITQNTSKYDAYFARCRERGQELWQHYLEQGGEKPEEDIRHDFKFGITDKYITVDTINKTAEFREMLAEILFLRTPWEQLTQDQQTSIGCSIHYTTVLFKDRKFGFGLEEVQ